MMKRRLAVVAILCVCIPAFAQMGSVQPTPTLVYQEGWRVSPFPMFGYTTDQGLMLGAYVDAFSYGRQPSIFPNYYSKLHLDISHCTKGQTLLYIEHDSGQLFPGLRLTTSFAWQFDPMCPFYGFGGSTTPYDLSLDHSGGVAYYNFKRNMLRGMFTLQQQISPHISIMGGAHAWYYSTADYTSDAYDGARSLYHDYVKAGVISPDELRGFVCELKAGLKWDSRDFEPDPVYGTFAEAYLVGAPNWFGGSYGYTKLCLHWRQFITPYNSWVTFAYHLACQATLAGQAPFYMQSNIYNTMVKQGTMEGLGGVNTVRGIMVGRLLGNGYAWFNLEARIRIWEWDYWGRHFSFAVNPFVDGGWIIQPYKVAELAAFNSLSIAQVETETGKFHPSVGIGIKVGLNRNLIGMLEIAKPFRREDGLYGTCFGANYIF